MRFPWLFGVTGVVVLAPGCSIGSSSHSTLTLSQAEKRARADGFVKVVHHTSPSWHCELHNLHFGSVQGDTTRGTRADYRLDFGDRRTPPTGNGSARVAMTIVLFPSASFAASCAAAGIYSTQHVAVITNSGQRSEPSIRISADTIAIGVHKPNIPGSLPGTTGEYDTWLAARRVLAFGTAYNRPDSRIVQADLARLAAQIAG